MVTLGVTSAYHFTELQDSWVKQHLTIVGLRLKRDLQGVPTLDFEELKDKKNIATTRSFEKPYTKFTELDERVTTFAVACAEKLRQQNACCNTLMVFIHTNGFRSDQPQYRKNTVFPLPYPTNSSIELAKFASWALAKIYKEGFAYKKAGVIVMDFTPEDTGQIEIFENSHPKHSKLMKAMDVLNKAYGQQKVKLASQDLKRVWKMRQERLSPRYTTDLNDIIVVSAN